MQKVSLTRSNRLVLLIALAILSCTTPSQEGDDGVSVPRPLHFHQCDAAWGTDQLGSSATVCSVGCLMSSAAMMLSVDDRAITQKVLNDWLMANDGYLNNAMYLAKIDQYASTHLSAAYAYQGKDTDLSLSHMKALLDGGHYCLMCVNSGGHWVLLYGYEGTGQTEADFRYHDPGRGDGASLAYDSAALGPSELAVYLRTP